MLGTTRLHTSFGAARRGFNTAGTQPLKSLINGYIDEGLAVLLVEPNSSELSDYRTPAMKKKNQKKWEEEGNEGPFPGGVHLATHTKPTMLSYVKRARKAHDGDIDARIRHGLTPLNLAIVPDKSRVVVVDCPGPDNVEAFRNWLMDVTVDYSLRKNLDMVPPSVVTPARIEGGTWEVAQPEQVYQDYGSGVYVPEVKVNRGGDIVHGEGGHWYFFYPDGFELPCTAPSAITVRYCAMPRTHVLEPLRAAEDAVSQAWDQASYDVALVQFQQALSAVEDVRLRAMSGEAAGPVAEFEVLLKERYVLVPPSSMDEGHFEVVSGDFAWEPALERLISGS